MVHVVLLLIVNWFYITMYHVEADHKIEEDHAQDYPEMDEEVEDMDPGWDDEGNGEGDYDADYDDGYNSDEYDDDELPDKGIIHFDNNW